MPDARGAASGVPGPPVASGSPALGAASGVPGPPAAPSAEQKGIDHSLVILLAVATGVAVASNYYVQPLLPTIRQTFHAGAGAVGLIVTASQIGYAAGLLLLLPLGDLLERRRLVVALALVTALGLAGAAVAPSLGLLYVAAVVIGATSVVGQILVAFSASLASDNERGRVVGTVMSGLFIGILLARTAAGFLGAALGWRAVYYVAGGVALVLAAVLRRALPPYREDVNLSYPGVLASVVTIFREQPVLRRPRVVRLARVRRILRALDEPRLPARRAPLRLRVGHDRAVRARRRGRHADGLHRRPPRRPRAPGRDDGGDVRRDPHLVRPSVGWGEPARRAVDRDRAARPRLPRAPHHEPERDLPPAAPGAQPA